jgi:putative transposase
MQRCVTTEKSGANKAAMHGINKDRDVPIEVRQIKTLNNIVEQDQRAVKRITKPNMGFESYRAPAMCWPELN